MNISTAIKRQDKNLSFKARLIDWLIDWKCYLISVAHLVKYYFRWLNYSYTIYTHSYYYIYNNYTYYLQIKLLKLLKIDIIVIKIEPLLKDS